jgi:antitoxin component YwqK of YwqJK toxin-antitoxin module
MKKKIYGIIILILTNISFQAQSLSVIELIQLSNKPNWESANTTLVSKGWEYYDSKAGDDENYNTVTWAFEKSNFDDKAQCWFKLFTYVGFPNKIIYTFRSKIIYNTIKQTLSANGFKYIDSEIKDDEVISKYVNPNFIIELSYMQKESDDYSGVTYTSYLVTVIKKAGIYDNQNGLKQIFDDNGNLESEYTLKDGVANGSTHAYYPNGKLKITFNYIDGKKQGISREYEENGDLTAEYNYLNGEPNGNFKIYENNKLKLIGSLLNGKRNGQFKVYNEEGRIYKEYDIKSDLPEGNYVEYYYDEGKLLYKVKGFYLNNEKTGKWQTIKITENGSEIIEFNTYIKNEKNGSFKEVRNDSIVFGTYKNGILDGSYKVYQSLKASILGGLHGDTTNCPLITVGNYSEGLKNGYWKFYSWSKKLIREGRYYNNLETGEWKYYFDNYVDAKGKSLPFSGKLFLTRTFEDGRKSGKETRYAFLENKKVPCDTINNRNINPLDTCYTVVFQNVFQTAYYKNDDLNGPTELKDSADVITEKGNFIHGKKDGLWLESYVNKDINDKNYYTYLRGNYIGGLETGNWDEFVTEDFIFAKYNYTYGKLNGKTTYYNRLKRPYEELYFKNGQFTELYIYDSLGDYILRSYLIFNETKDSYNCKKTIFFRNGKASHSQVYTFKKKNSEKINYNLFEFIFITSIGENSDGSSGYPDGEFKVYDNKERVISEGTVYKKDKIGVWKYYYYDVNIYTEQEFINSNNYGFERYFTFTTKQLFSGKFVQKYDNGKLKFEFKISEGLRDGKSKYFSKDEKNINIEKYEKGVLKN